MSNNAVFMAMVRRVETLLQRHLPKAAERKRDVLYLEFRRDEDVTLLLEGDRTLGGLCHRRPCHPVLDELGNALNDLVRSMPEQGPAEALADLLTTPWILRVEEGVAYYPGPLVYLYYRPYAPEWLDGLRERDAAPPAPPPFAIEFGQAYVKLNGKKHEIPDPDALRAFKAVYDGQGKRVSGKSLGISNLSQTFDRHLPAELFSLIRGKSGRGYTWDGSAATT
jgi:hypothetical protein